MHHGKNTPSYTAAWRNLATRWSPATFPGLESSCDSKNYSTTIRGPAKPIPGPMPRSFLPESPRWPSKFPRFGHSAELEHINRFERFSSVPTISNSVQPHSSCSPRSKFLRKHCAAKDRGISTRSIPNAPSGILKSNNCSVCFGFLCCFLFLLAFLCLFLFVCFFVL